LLTNSSDETALHDRRHDSHSCGGGDVEVAAMCLAWHPRCS
jgi:hypothetical protein